METTDDPEIVDPPFWSKTSWIQIGYSLWVNQVVVLIGLAFGFSAVTLPQLRKPGARFSTTPDELAWIVSVVLLSPPIGCIISGFAMDKIGRRLMMVFSLTPMVFGWFYTGFATSATDMIVGRVITGISIGLCAGVPRTFCTEITLPNVRGVAGVFPTLAIGVGITVEGLLGSCLEWPTLCHISGSYSAILMVLNIFLPETPYFVLMTDDINKTRQALKRIRSKKYDIDREIAEMESFQLYNNIQKLSTKEMIYEIFKPHAYKPFLIIIVYIIIGQMVGISIMMFWTVDILKATRSSVDPYVGNVILGMTRLFSTVVTCIAVFWVRRRPLALGSALAVCVICIGLGLFLNTKPSSSIIPQIAFILYIGIASLGYYSLPLMMLFELVPLQVRGLLGGITISLVFLLMFLANKLFPIIVSGLGINGTIILFGTFSLIGFAFLYPCLPETKDLTLHDIEEFYRGRRDSLKRVSIAIRRSHGILRLKQEEDETPLEAGGSSSNVKSKRSSVTFSIANRRVPGGEEGENKGEEVNQDNITGTNEDNVMETTKENPVDTRRK